MTIAALFQQANTYKLNDNGRALVQNLKSLDTSDIFKYPAVSGTCIQCHHSFSYVTTKREAPATTPR
jgi:hypothetical protein